MNYARPGTQKDIPVAEAKEKVLQLIGDGLKVDEACAVVGRKRETYRSWMKDDERFRAGVRQIRDAQGDRRSHGPAPVPGFEDFCRDWLKQPLHPHQLRMLDVIEGREPRDLHPSMTFRPGYDNRVLINIPPEHAKSTTFTVNYTVWLIHKNPDVRVVIISQGIDLAKKFLYEIKFKLTSPVFREMHARFAPVGPDGTRGWRDVDSSWTTDAIYVRGKNLDGVQKDPTVQVMGLKGTIYGQRADMIIMDDCITTKNVGELNFQTNVLEREIESRLPSDAEGGGLLLILGTRVAPLELYKQLQKVVDSDDQPVWTYFRMPAVLDYGDGDSSTWLTLWPEKWPGRALARRRRVTSWNLVYQQLDVDDDMTFKAEAVNAAVNGRRFPGRQPMITGPGARDNGFEGCYTVAGLDPAASGCSAMIIAAMDKATNKRWIVDGWNKPNALAGDIINQIRWAIDTYSPNELVIEQNGLQRFIAQLPEIQDYARSRGTKITPHHTTKNKFDSDWGVQTMAPLFDSCVNYDEKANLWRPVRHEDALIELPSMRQNAWVSELVQQLTTWQPEGMTQHQKTDLVMAMWFTHLAFLNQIKRNTKNQVTHFQTPFTTSAHRRAQRVVSLAEIRRAKQLEGEAV